jgi:hypothetical protein
MEWIERCTRGASFYKLDARVSSNDSAAITFGSHLHSAMEMHYRLQEYNLSTDEIKTRIADMLSEAFMNEPIDEGDFRQVNWAIQIYEKYVEKFEFEDMDLLRYDVPRKCGNCKGTKVKVHLTPVEELIGDDTNSGVELHKCPWCNGTGLTSIMTEVPFVVPLFDAKSQNGELRFPVLYHGFIDLPVSINGLIHTLDFKSTSVLGDVFWADKKMSAQQKGYCFGLHETTKLPVHGYIVRAIRVNPPPQYVTNGTANKKGEFKKISDWWQECFAEEKYHLGEGEIQEWKNNAIALVEEFLWHYSKGYFPKRTISCTNKFGKCQYYDVCSTFPVEDRNLILMSGLFKDKTSPTPNITS